MLVGKVLIMWNCLGPKSFKIHLTESKHEKLTNRQTDNNLGKVRLCLPNFIMKDITRKHNIVCHS